MFNLSDIMQAAQGGQAMMNLALQFGLSPVETQRAVQALLPAFSLGLQRHTQTPADFASILGLMGTGQFAPFFDAAGATKSVNAAAQGGAVIEQIFGKPEVSRQVAAHAAVLSGVPTEVLVRMLPIIATLIMGGLFRAAVENGFAGLFDQIGEAMRRAGSAFGLPQGEQARAGSEREAHAGPSGDIFGPIVASMFDGIAGKAEPKVAWPTDAAASTQSADPVRFGLEHLNRMFEAGTQVQRDYVETMQKIFERFSAGNRQDD